MKKVLFLANENERATISCLRALTKHNVDVYLAFSNKSSINHTIFKSYIKDKSYYYNRESSTKFINSLINIQEEIGDFFLFNFGDKITRWTIEYRNELSENGIQIKSPTLQAFDLMLNKHSFAEICLKYKLDVPKEISAERYLTQNLFEDKFVVKAKSNVIKSDDSLLTEPMLIENKRTWRKLKKSNLDLEKHFVQKYINGPSVYYCAYYESGCKKIHFIQKNIAQQPGGKSVVKAVPSNMPIGIIETVDSIMKDLNWEGVMMYEFKEHNGKYYAIECNPRLWGPLQLAVDNGINIPAYILGINTSNKNKNNKEIGYLWSTGYLIGILYKFQTKTNFQLHSKDRKTTSITYKDVWFRKDTFSYGFLELLLVIKNQLKKVLKIKS